LPASYAGAQTKTSCKPDTTAPTAADIALFHNNDKEAEELYRAELQTNADDEHAHFGLVRTLLDASKGKDAENIATAFLAAHPQSSIAETAMAGLLQFQGKIPEAYQHASKALALNPCNGYAHYRLGALLRINSMSLSAKEHWNAAHTLLPNDEWTTQAWMKWLPVTESIAAEEAYLQTDLDDQTRQTTANWIDFAKSRQQSPCTVRSASVSGKIKFAPLYQERAPAINGWTPFGDIYGRWVVQVEMNGVKTNLILNTDRDEILLSRKEALKIGLTVPPPSTGKGNNTYRAKVKSMKIGGLEYENCSVVVKGESTVAGVEGLLALGALRDSMVSLDFQAREMTLDPLPAAPPEYGTDRDIHNRYVAPEMKSWSPAYHNFELWLVPTRVADKQSGLFMLSIEDQTDDLDLEFAKPIAKLEKDTSTTLGNPQDEIHPMVARNDLTLQFAGVREKDSLMLAYPLSGYYQRVYGITVSGTLGLESFAHAVLQLDYRDGLIKVSPAAKH